MGKKLQLKWEHVAKYELGLMMPWASLRRARFGKGWIVWFMYHAGTPKSSGAQLWIEDPESAWVKEPQTVLLDIMDATRTPNDYLVVHRLDITMGTILAFVSGTRQITWSDLIFIPGPPEAITASEPGPEQTAVPQEIETT